MRLLRELALLVREVRRGLRATRRRERLRGLLRRTRGASALGPTPVLVPAAPPAPGGPVADIDTLLERVGAESRANMKTLEEHYGPLASLGFPTAAGIVEAPRPGAAGGYCQRCGTGGAAGSICPCPPGADAAQNGPRASVNPATAG